jgi:hypothetical protein
MTQTNLCSKCEEIKPLHYFGRSKDTPDQLKYICRTCDAAIHRARYYTEAETLKARSKANRDRARRDHLCLSCYKPIGERQGRKYCEACARVATRHQRDRRDRMRDACIAAYGGAACVCCKETEPKFLTLDHTNNNGSAHRRTICEELNLKRIGSFAFYRALVKAGFPPGLQVMCFNCNLGRQRNGGICPHKEITWH